MTTTQFPLVLSRPNLHYTHKAKLLNGGRYETVCGAVEKSDSKIEPDGTPVTCLNCNPPTK